MNAAFARSPALQNPFPMRELYATLACCALVTLCLSQRGLGWMLLNVLPPISSVWLAFLAYGLWKRKKSLRLQLAKAGILFVGVGIAAGTHAYMHLRARNDALRVSAAAEAFFVAHGTYPCSMGAVGLEESDERTHRQLADLYCLEGVPHLWYFSSFRPYEMEEYSFRGHAWNRVDASPD